MKNSEYFKSTYDEIHAPEALFGKVMGMNMERKELKTRNLVKYAFCVMAVLIVTFVASNGICYAATGETLITKVNVYMNEKTSELDLNWKKEGDMYHGEIDLPSEDGDAGHFSIEVPDPEQLESLDVKINEEEEGAAIEVIISDEGTNNEESSVDEEVTISSSIEE